ncbi:MAG: sodium:solute symporter [Bacteroidetes bacterium]|nr:sodium:solute symporter [Bacteroidota bacterium]
MAGWLLLGLFIGYFAFLGLIGYVTGKNSSEQTFHQGGRKTAWFIIALGMVADSLSGVTFISIPGNVHAQGFSYMQIVLGYFIGYQIIAAILIPLYFKLNLTSIYEYLYQRFGFMGQKTGSAFFLISRIIGASGRLFLAVSVFQFFFLDAIGVPLEITVIVLMALMYAYTYKGGIKTLIWTDSIQALMMILGLVVTLFAIQDALNLSISDWSSMIRNSWWITEPNQAHFWGKDILAGAFIALSMTGLDQTMMQKSLACKQVKDAQKNMFWFAFLIAIVNFAFLALGAALSQYLSAKGMQNIDLKADYIFPFLAFEYLGPIVMVAFTLGLIAASLSSADSVLTTLTTAFCVDFLDFGKSNTSSPNRQKIRTLVHLGFAFLLWISIMAFDALTNDSLIYVILSLAGYTYGPLLGLFTFGLLIRKLRPIEWTIPLIACISVVLTWTFAHVLAPQWNYSAGFELLPLNGCITFLGLWISSLLQPQYD